MFPKRVVSSSSFASRFTELLPEYLPGMDTGAFEPTDRRRCWNKTLAALLSVIGKEDHGLTVAVQDPSVITQKDQSSLLWKRDGAAVFAMATGWGDRSELEVSLDWLKAFKCPQKLFVYSCSKWQEAVLDQIRASLLRYPYHIEGEQYLFMNLIGSENRLYLYTTDLNQSGRLLTSPLLEAVTASPFKWRTRSNLLA